MAQVNGSQASHGHWANETERDASLWASQAERMTREFESQERREMRALKDEMASIRARYESNKNDMAAQLPNGSAQKLDQIFGRPMAAELEILQRDFETAKARRAGLHVEEMSRHFKRFPTSMSASKHLQPPSRSPTRSAAPYIGASMHHALGPSGAASHSQVMRSVSATSADQPPKSSFGPASVSSQSHRPPAQAGHHGILFGSSTHGESQAHRFWETTQSRSIYDTSASSSAERRPPFRQDIHLHPLPSQYTVPSQRPAQQASPTRSSSISQPGQSAPSTYHVSAQDAVSASRRSSGNLLSPTAQPANSMRMPNASQQPDVDHHSAAASWAQSQFPRVSPREQSFPQNRPSTDLSRPTSSGGEERNENWDMPMRAKRKVDIYAASEDPSSKRSRGLNGMEDAAARSSSLSGDANADSSVSQPQQQQQFKKVPHRTISFDEIYQGGDPEFKHFIVEFPPGKGVYYILRCDEHGVHFNATNPLAGAAKHLAGSQHGHMSKEHAKAIEEVGHLVLECTAEMQKLNNDMVTAAFENGYKLYNRNYLTKRERNSTHGVDEVPNPVAPRTRRGSHLGSQKQETTGLALTSPPTAPKRPFTGLTDPAANELYRAYWSREKRNYAVLVLPWHDLGPAGWKGTLASTGLLVNAPKCYVIDRSVPEIKGWAAGFEDGGALVSKREFPVCYFDKASSVGWVRARDLSVFKFEDRDSVPDYDRAVQHYAAIKGYPSFDAMKTAASKLIADTDSIAEKRVDSATVTTAENGKKESTEKPAAETHGATEPRDEIMADASPMPQDDTDSYRASESRDTEEDVDMDGTESRRTSVSNKPSAPQKGEEAPAKPSAASPRASVPETEDGNESMIANSIVVGVINTAASDVSTLTPSNSETTPRDSSPTGANETAAPREQDNSPVQPVLDVANEAAALDSPAVRSPRGEDLKQVSVSFQNSPPPVGTTHPNPRRDASRPESRGGEAARPATDLSSEAPVVPETHQGSTILVAGTILRSPASPTRSIHAGANGENSNAKWRAVRTSPDYPTSTQTKPSAEPQSNTASRPSETSSLPPKSVSGQSPLITPSPSAATTRASSPNVMRVAVPLAAEAFDISCLDDERTSQGSDSSALLTFNKVTKAFEGTLDGSSTPVAIDAAKIDKITVDVKDSEGQTSIASLSMLGDHGSYTLTLTFERRESAGKGMENGRIHARRFVRYARTGNSSIQYINKSHG